MDDQNAGALAQHEAVAVDVPWPTRGGRVVIAGGHRARGIEAADGQLAHGALGAAGHHDIGLAVFDLAHALANRMVGRAAGRHDREVRPLEAVLDRQQTGDHVDDRAGNEKRGDLSRATVGERFVGVLNHRQAADAGAD